MSATNNVSISEEDIPLYAALADFSYRRRETDYGLELEIISLLSDGVQLRNPFRNITAVEAEQLLNNFLTNSGSENSSENFTHLATVNGTNDRLGFQVSDRDDGVFHIYNALGLSAFVVQNGDEFIVTFRGTDVGGLLDDSFGLFRGTLQALPSRDDHRPDDFTNIGQIGDHENDIDEGDLFTNIQLGSGTENVTQYDYALALTRFVIENLAGGYEHVNDVTVVGHSLGAGLATLVGAELGTNLVTFAAAPFENQLEFIAAKNAARDIIARYPDVFDHSAQFGVAAFDRSSALEIGEFFLSAVENDGTSTAHFFGGTLQLPPAVFDDFQAELDTYLASYLERIDAGFFSAVQGEFTSSIGGSEFRTGLTRVTHYPTDEFSPTIDDYDNVFYLGENLSEFVVKDVHFLDHAATIGAITAIDSQTSFGRGARADFLGALNFTGEGSYRHAGSLHSLMWATELDNTVTSFADILRSDNFLRFSLFHTPGLAGSFIEDKVGEEGDPSISRGGNLSVEPFYRLLSTSAITNNGFYAYFSDFIGVAGELNSILAPVLLGGNADPTQKNLHSAVIELSLQIIRDAVSGATDFTDFESNLRLNGVNNFQFAGDFEADGYITLNLDAIKAISRDPDQSGEVNQRLQEAIYSRPPLAPIDQSPGFLLPPDYYSAYGITDLGQAIFDRLIAEGLSEFEAIEYTKIEILPNGFINYVPFATGFGAQVDTLIVQTLTGSLSRSFTPGRVEIDLSAQTDGGAAIFLDADDGSPWNDNLDLIFGTQADDFIFGNGNNNYIAGNGGNDVIIGGHGDDIILAGQGSDFIYGGEDYPITEDPETGEFISSDVDTLIILEDVVNADDFNHEFIRDTDGNIIAEAGIITATVGPRYFH